MDSQQNKHMNRMNKDKTVEENTPEPGAELTREALSAALDEARQINRQKSEFLARMSHGIRTPMNAIIGLTYLSKETPDVPQKVMENLDKIDMSAHFLLDFINDILNLSQLESGSIAFDKKRVDMNEFLSEINKEVAQAAGKKKLIYVPSVQGELDKEYMFDADMLKHALMNVLRNAVKFTPAEGNVIFVTELENQTTDVVNLRFEITDNGIGMEKDFQSRAFEAFEQEKGENTTISGGNGLGLTIARNIIEQMKGSVELESEKGQGTTVVIKVSLERVQGESRANAGKENAADYDFTGKRALIVEDNEINIEIAKNILAYKNFETEVVMNGEDCLEAFSSHEPGYYDVILMDIIMPVMDGLTTTRLLRNLERADSKTIPVIAMTANAFEADLKKSMDAGMNGYLSKPIDIKKMYALLQEVLY